MCSASSGVVAIVNENVFCWKKVTEQESHQLVGASETIRRCIYICLVLWPNWSTPCRADSFYALTMYWSILSNAKYCFQLQQTAFLAFLCVRDSFWPEAASDVTFGDAIDRLGVYADHLKCKTRFGDGTGKPKVKKLFWGWNSMSELTTNRPEFINVGFPKRHHQISCSFILSFFIDNK